MTSDLEQQIARLSERITNASREDLENILNDVRTLLNQLPTNTQDSHTNRLLMRLQGIQQRAMELYALYHAQSTAHSILEAGGEGIKISASDILFLASTPLEISVAPFFSNVTRKLFEGINPFGEYLVQQRDPGGQLKVDAHGQPALTRIMGHHLRADISTVQFHALPAHHQQHITQGLIAHSNAASAAQLQDIGRLHTALDRLEAASTAAVYTSTATTGVQEVHITRIHNRFDTARTAAHHAGTAVTAEAAAARQHLADILRVHILPDTEDGALMAPVAAQESGFGQCINFSWGPHTIFSPGFTPLHLPAAIVSSLLEQ